MTCRPRRRGARLPGEGRSTKRKASRHGRAWRHEFVGKRFTPGTVIQIRVTKSRSIGAVKLVKDPRERVLPRSPHVAFRPGGRRRASAAEPGMSGGVKLAHPGLTLPPRADYGRHQGGRFEPWRTDGAALLCLCRRRRGRGARIEQSCSLRSAPSLPPEAPADWAAQSRLDPRSSQASEAPTTQSTGRIALERRRAPPGRGLGAGLRRHDGAAGLPPCARRRLLCAAHRRRHDRRQRMCGSASTAPAMRPSCSTQGARFASWPGRPRAGGPGAPGRRSRPAARPSWPWVAAGSPSPPGWRTRRP